MTPLSETEAPASRLRDAANLFITVQGTGFAYRRQGAPGGVPLVMLNHWGRCWTISIRASSMRWPRGIM